MTHKGHEVKCGRDCPAPYESLLDLVCDPAHYCPHCGMTSHNPNDAREGYCGNCHHWCEDVDILMRELGAHDPDCPLWCCS